MRNEPQHYEKKFATEFCYVMNEVFEVASDEEADPQEEEKKGDHSDQEDPATVNGVSLTVQTILPSRIFPAEDFSVLEIKLMRKDVEVPTEFALERVVEPSEEIRLKAHLQFTN